VISDKPLTQEALAYKRRRLLFLRDRVRNDREELYRLEGELGNVVCEACGKAHADACAPGERT